MQRLEFSGAVRPLEWSLGFKGFNTSNGAGINSVPISLYLSHHLHTCTCLRAH